MNIALIVSDDDPLLFTYAGILPTILLVSARFHIFLYSKLMLHIKFVIHERLAAYLAIVIYIHMINIS